MSKINAALLENGNYQELYNESCDIEEEYAVPDSVRAAEDAKNPAHYKDMVPGYEYIDLMEHLLGYEGTVSHLLGQLYKYQMRYGKKDSVLQESKKIAWYAAKLEDVEQRYALGEFPSKSKVDRYCHVPTPEEVEEAAMDQHWYSEIEKGFYQDNDDELWNK